MEREGPEVLIYDEEFEDLLEGLPESITRVVSWHEEDATSGADAHRGADRARRPRPDARRPDQDARFVILTSGTTGTPKGAQRSNIDRARQRDRADGPDSLPTRRAR